MADDSAYLLYSRWTGIARNGKRRTLVEYWRVPNYDRTGTIEDALTTDGLPEIGDSKYSGDNSGDNSGVLYCSQVEPVALDPEEELDVCVTWVEDPVSLPLVVNSYATRRTIAAYVDSQGTAIVNSAGDPYVPGLTMTRAVYRYEIIKRFSISHWFNLDVVGNFVDQINSDDFDLNWTDANGDSQSLSWPAYTAYLDDVHAPMVSEPYQHVQATFMFLVDMHISDTAGLSFGDPNDDEDNNQYDGWSTLVPDMGGRFLDPTTGNITAMTDDNGNRIGIGFLDGSGHKLYTTDTPFNAGGSSIPVINAFYVIPDTSFSSLQTALSDS